MSRAVDRLPEEIVSNIALACQEDHASPPIELRSLSLARRSWRYSAQRAMLRHLYIRTVT